MPYTQNGWLHLHTAALQAKYLTTISIPGTDPLRRFRVRKGNVAKVFAWFITEFHREVESLNEGHPNDDWSFADRPVRGSSSTSNHASGTAVDLNATQHPLGTSPTANFTAKQRTAIRRLVARTHGVIRWGGDYSGRKDPMHFEINASASAVAALAAEIAAPTQPKPEPKDGIDAMTAFYYDVQPGPFKALGETEDVQPLEFDRGEKKTEWWKGVVSSGAKQQEFMIWLDLTFDNDDLEDGETVRGRVNWTIHNEDGSEHDDYGSSPFDLCRWIQDDPRSLPGRQVLLSCGGKVYGPDRYLRASIELSKSVRLEKGQARVHLKKES